MQTDSHMDFSDNFDVGLVDMFHKTENDYAVLSTYVTDIEQNNKDPNNVPHLCMVEFTSSIRNWGTKECTNLRKPKLTNGTCLLCEKFVCIRCSHLMSYLNITLLKYYYITNLCAAMWGAGLSFHRCHAEVNVPVDPYLDNVFDGEEGSRGIRFFTHGYDVYTPHRVLVTHDYVSRNTLVAFYSFVLLLIILYNSLEIVAPRCTYIFSTSNSQVQLIYFVDFLFVLITVNQHHR
jgi:hypothetical protein